MVRRLDPRTKLAWLLASFAAALLPQRPEVAVLVLLLVLFHLALARALGELRRLQGLLLALAFFSVAVWSCLARGPTPLFWRVSAEGLAYGVTTFMKLAAMMAAGLALLATTPAEELFRGLVKLGLPYPGAFAFTLALRWVPEVFATARRVREAQEARGLKWEEGGPLNRLRRLLPLLAPIFLLTLRRSQAVAWGLEARGFQMSPRRTYLLEICLAPRDWLALGLAGLVLAFFIFLHLAGWDRIPGLRLS
jgi:energy-coupling factor transport system permease protein